MWRALSMSRNTSCVAVQACRSEKRRRVWLGELRLDVHPDRFGHGGPIGRGLEGVNVFKVLHVWQSLGGVKGSKDDSLAVFYGGDGRGGDHDGHRVGAVHTELSGSRGSAVSKTSERSARRATVARASWKGNTPVCTPTQQGFPSSCVSLCSHPQSHTIPHSETSFAAAMQETDACCPDCADRRGSPAG